MFFFSCNVSAAEDKVIKLMKRKILEPTQSRHIIRKSKKRKGGPNPLSCKKKKTKPANENKGKVNRKPLDV